MTNDREDDRTESVRSAWTRRLRQEALRMRRGEVSKIVHVGIIIATYADADGTNARMAAETLATIVGSSRETITRAVRVLVALGLLDRKRRPNATAMHTLLLPLDEVDWDSHLHLYTDTRQSARKKLAKQQDVLRRLAEADPGDALNPFTPAYWAANPESDWRPLGDPGWTPPAPDGTAFQNAVRTAFPTGSPDSVPDGQSGQRSHGGFQDSGPRSGTHPDRVARRGPDRVPAGGEHRVLPPVGDPRPDTRHVEPVAQPQVRAREADQDQISRELQALPGGGRRPAGDHQAPLLLSVQAGPPTPLDHSLIAAHMTALYGTPVPLRRAATAALEILGDLAVPDPTAYVLGVLDADPGRYRPSLPAATPAPRRRAGGDS